jgi:three-Cys-motif partner protein
MDIEIAIDPSDGLPACKAGDWAFEKHELLRKYVEICRGPRRMFLAGTGGATYIELFAGPGRLFNDRGNFFDGSPLVAHKEAARSGTPFTEMHLGDQREDFCSAVETRLQTRGAKPRVYPLDAEAAARSIVGNLNQYGYNFAFLDPFGLEGLPFRIIETLAAFRRMDVLIHVSAQSLQRNLPAYMVSQRCVLDEFAPGWRKVVEGRAPDEQSRGKILEHWIQLIRNAGFIEARGMPLIRGTGGQALYWLVLVAKHELAVKFWDVVNDTGQENLFG